MNDIILSVTIANYRSIKAPVKIPLASDSSKVIGLYGPNASGKTNIIRAIKVMKSMVLFSSNADYLLPYDPFRFTEEHGVPTSFKADFAYGNYVLRYSFSFTSIRVCQEYLGIKSGKTEKFKTLFERKERRIINPSAVNYGFGNKLLARTRQNSLLLTKAYEDNNPFAFAIVSIMQRLLFASFGDNDIENEAYSIMDKYPSIKRVVSKQLALLDPSIGDILTRRIRLPNNILQSLSFDDELRRKLISDAPIDARIVRRYQNRVYPQRISEESVGTRAIISILVLLKYAEREGKTVFIDEFGNYLHPSVTSKIIELYQHSTAQNSLIISSHQLGLYTYMGRSERVTVTKDLVTGATKVGQKRASNSPRRNREDLVEAENNFGYKIMLVEE